MSIETERWMQSHDAVWADSPGRELVAECASFERARQVVVLPEALALLKELEAQPGGVADGVDRARDILKRAGVLK